MQLQLSVACLKILPVFLPSEMREHHLRTVALHFAELTEGPRTSLGHEFLPSIFSARAVSGTLAPILATFFCVQCLCALLVTMPLEWFCPSFVCNGMRVLLVTPAPEMVVQVESRGSFGLLRFTILQVIVEGWAHQPLEKLGHTIRFRC
jgi:hypothetical protein